jgi:hypothetical protein
MSEDKLFQSGEEFLDEFLLESDTRNKFRIRLSIIIHHGSKWKIAVPQGESDMLANELTEIVTRYAEAKLKRKRNA